MNIDIRNINFEKDLADIMAEYDDINTGAAAVKKAATGYLDYKNKYLKTARLLEDQETLYKDLINALERKAEADQNIAAAVADYAANGDISGSNKLIHTLNY